MDDTFQNMPCCRLNQGRACTLSRLDDIGAGVQLRARFVDLADEDVNPTKGDLVPVFDSTGLGTPSCVVDVELTAMTFRHPAHSVSLESIKAALQELKTIVR